MKEAIILAGGFGTRLKHIVSEVPKPMAMINNIPFLTFLFQKLQKEGVKHIILSTGYMHGKIADFYGNKFETIDLTYSHETTPLGTGGAILLALEKATTDDVLILNGDTLFDIDIQKFEHFHALKKGVLSVSLREMEDVSRYGSVVLNNEKKIIAFTEKNETKSPQGAINGGIYILRKEWYLKLDLPEKFSFEKDVLENLYQQYDFYGLGYNSYFIDIGVPEDYFRAQIEFKKLF